MSKVGMAVVAKSVTRGGGQNEPSCMRLSHQLHKKNHLVSQVPIAHKNSPLHPPTPHSWRRQFGVGIKGVFSVVILKSNDVGDQLYFYYELLVGIYVGDDGVVVDSGTTFTMPLASLYESMVGFLVVLPCILGNPLHSARCQSYKSKQVSIIPFSRLHVGITPYGKSELAFNV
ncbi:hypothetical protein Fmac_024533 [Flemingia macrophylla]|uniref:Uncharacterized protein n=1 Tax=Flemingia macrophylla TaxID=520843 RepID=A0ABD1LRF1_9FABA